MGCFPSKQVNDGRALDRSSISHQTQYPTQSLHDADTESVVFTAGRPSFGFNQIPPQMAPASALPRKSLGTQPGKSKPMLPAHLQLQSHNNNYSNSLSPSVGGMQQVVSSVGATMGSAGAGRPLGSPSLNRARSFGREPSQPMSAGAVGIGGKPKVSFAAQMMLKEREREMMWEPQAGGGHSLPPMTAPPTRETFGR
ncbi:hypothetical protein ONZ45_g17307 [Pleurotus djamor]|nr:hypothetical protein ONZ45_g17307 [Pleurotus djamor]